MSIDEETRLAALMDDSASRMTVGAAPAAQVFADGRRGRRRRARVVAAGSAAVVLAVVGALGVVTGQFRGADVGPAGLPTPEGQWIGMGHVFLDVGTDWEEGHVCDPERAATNLYDVSSWGSVDVVCGEYEPTGTLVSFSPLDEGADTATLSQQLERQYGSVRTETVDGHEVLRSGVRCTEVGEANSGNGFTPATERKCFAGIDVPSQGVTLSVWSHEDEATIDALLDTLHIAPGHVAVPGVTSTPDGYLDALLATGLQVRVMGAPVAEDSLLVEIKPAPGTAVEAGDEITLTVYDRDRFPEDDLSAITVVPELGDFEKVYVP